MERSITGQAVGLASITLLQNLIETLLDTKAITLDQAEAVFRKSIEMHQGVTAAVTGPHNSDAAYALQQIWDDIRKGYGPDGASA